MLLLAMLPLILPAVPAVLLLVMVPCLLPVWLPLVLSGVPLIWLCPIALLPMHGQHPTATSSTASY